MKRILLATDFSDLARSAYPPAVSLAERFGAKIELVHEDQWMAAVFFDEIQTAILQGGYHDRLRESLQREAELPAFAGVETSTRLLHLGSDEESLVGLARIESADMIVLATHGRTGLSHSVLGSFAEHTARHATVPVLSCRPDPALSEGAAFHPRSILVPFDFSENSKPALALAAQMAAAYGSQVRVLHVLPEVSVRGDWGNVQERLRVSRDGADRLEARLREIVSQSFPDQSASLETRYGDAYREIIREADRTTTDLITMATHGWTGIERFYMGSVAEKVLRTSPCPVLTIRPRNVHAEPSSE